jgi:hypothetical protein
MGRRIVLVVGLSSPRSRPAGWRVRGAGGRSCRVNPGIWAMWMATGHAIRGRSTRGRRIVRPGEIVRPLPAVRMRGRV